MIKIAFTIPYFKNWFGGYNYIVNLIKALSGNSNIHPVLFIGNDIDDEVILPFKDYKYMTIIKDKCFNLQQRDIQLLYTLLLGVNFKAHRIFVKHDINVVFESAHFYGVKFPIPVISWLPDFQHKHMPNRFTFFSYWRRELGFILQTKSGRRIMVSSEDSKNDCERFYPVSIGSIDVVQFAIVKLLKMQTDTLKRNIYLKYSLPDSFYFLPNQYWTHKNHECVIEAINIANQRGIKLNIIVTGKLPDSRNHKYYRILTKKIESYGIGNSFIQLGLIPFEDLNAILLNCKALINPSYFEGWSTTVEEAKGTKTPMILSSIKVHKEQAEKSAFYFNPDKPDILADILIKCSNYTRNELSDMCYLSNYSYDENINNFKFKLSQTIEGVAKIKIIK